MKTNKTRKILSLVLALVVAISVMPMTGFTAFAEDAVACAESGCTGTYTNGFCSADATHYQAAATDANGVYQIGNAGQLYWFAAYVNSYTQLAGANTPDDTADDVYSTSANAVLTADITDNVNVMVDGELNSDYDSFRQWTPIGNNNYVYTGTFDGKEHTISGLFCTVLKGYLGIFGYVSGGTVQNVKIADSYIKGNRNISGIVGRCDPGSTIKSCYVESTCLIKAAAAYCGGIAGYNIGTIADCTNSANVLGTSTSPDKVGGIAGYNSGTVTGCKNASSAIEGIERVGGIAGENRGTVKQCVTSETKISGSGFVGGVVGYNRTNSSTRESVVECSSSAVVEGSGKNIGGVVGYNFEGNIIDCRNTGTVTGTQCIGGVVGCLRMGSAVNSYNTGTVNGDEYCGGVVGRFTTDTIAKCYNTGEVSGNSYIGGIVGGVTSEGILTNCYNLGSVVSVYQYVGGVAGYVTIGTVTNCYNLARVKGYREYLGGVAGGLATDGTVSNCFYLSGCTDGYWDIDQYGIGNESLYSNTPDVDGITTGMTSEQFESGEPAYLLQKDQTTRVWGQNIDNGGTNEGRPVFSEARVYYGYFFCNDEAKIYTNKATALEEKPHHTSETYTVNSDGTHSLTCTACGEDVTEPHYGGTANCVKLAACEFCGEDYGDFGDHVPAKDDGDCTTPVDCTVCTKVAIPKKDSHTPAEDDGDCTTAVYCAECDQIVTEAEEAHIYDDEGFCANGCYEPAVWNEETKVYEISKAGHLYWLAYKVNNDNENFGSANAILTTDIVVNKGTVNASSTDARTWLPIGNETYAYSGTFEGNGKTVSGLYFNDISAGYVGLFGNVGSGGKVQNLGVTNSYILAYGCVGGIAGINSGTVTNCYNVCNIYSSGGGGAGVVGSNAGTVTECYNTGDVISSVDSGASTCVGGVAGENAGAVSNCYNTGNVTGSGGGIGGVVGVNSSSTAAVTNCYNTGTVTNNSTGSAIQQTGGVIGVGSSTNCYYLDTAYSGGINGEDVAGSAEAKTAGQFASGEVAYLLQSGNTTQVWGQDNNQAGATPVFDSTGLYKAVKIAETGNYSVAKVGDVNGDETVDVNDYQLLVNMALSDGHEESESSEYSDIIKYDANGDGYVDVLDASLTERMINGHITVDVFAVGDCDQNGVAFEAADITKLQENIDNAESLSTAQKYACDLNADGVVDIFDLMELKKR